MKKSKLLQSSREMLSRSFNPTKCKTSLRLAASRLKLLKNKKEVQVKQMRKEIAQLLESGQEQTARMRVEHVIREEKMMAAYDLLEIYSELIVARLPIIESQKSCPIDLKEAIASVIFASLRCGDVPELLDVRKQLTAKYGKDFATAAIELRPQSGVGRMLVEKLSAGAPDVQTKTKILSAIAEEHNVEWDHETLEEKDSIPSSDPPGKPHVEQPASSNVLQHDPRISMEAETVTSAEPSFVSSASRTEARPQGDNRAQLFQGDINSGSPGRQRWNMEFKDATSAAQAAAESAELASFAAKAAAELSMHNRITESHGSDPYISKGERSESHSNPRFSREQFLEESLKKSSPVPTGSRSGQIDRINPNDHKIAPRFNEDNHTGPEESNQSVSLKSKSSITDDPVNLGVPVVNQYSQKNPLEDVSPVEASMKKQSFKHEADPSNDWAEKAESHPEKKIEKSHSASSSRSHSSISDDVNIFANPEYPKYENDAGENPFVDITEGGIHEEESFHQTSSHEDAAIVYDQFDSDTEDHGFDLGPKYDNHYSGFDLPSLNQNSPEHLPGNTDSWNPRFKAAETVHSTSPPPFFFREKSSSNFSENLTSRDDDAEVDNFAPVAFDDSDGPSSDIEEDMNSGHHEVKDSRGDLSKIDEREQSSALRFEDTSRQSSGSRLGWSGVNRNQLSISSDNEFRSEELDPHGRLNLGKHSAEQPVLQSKESRKELSNIGDESSSDSEGLNFGKLMGGLRNKGSRNALPFLKNRMDVSPSVLEAEKTTETTRTSTAPHADESPGTSTMLHSSKITPELHTESDSDSSEDEEILRRHSDLKQETHTHKEVKTKSSLGASNLNFGSDSSDLDEGPPKESLNRKSHLRGGVSRRTRAPPSSRNNSSTINLRSEANDTDAGFDRNPITSYSSQTQKNSERRNSGTNSEQHTAANVASKPAKPIFWVPPEQLHSMKTTSMSVQESKTGLRSEVHDTPANAQPKVQSLNRKSTQLDISDQPTSPKMASKPPTSSLVGSPEKLNSGKATSTAMQKSKITHKPSTVEEPSKPPQKPEESISSEVSKLETSDKISSNTSDGPKRASHVHPKLPDYDVLLQSLRMNRS